MVITSGSHAIRIEIAYILKFGDRSDTITLTLTRTLTLTLTLTLNR